MIKGKDFFSRKSKSDNFDTPFSMIEQLLEHEIFDQGKKILEPACGKGAILDILKNHFEWYDVDNIYSRDILYSENQDFLIDQSLKNIPIDYIITNPPYSIFDKFVEKAKLVAKEKFAFLGRLEFLTGINRYNNKLYFDGNYNLKTVYQFVRKANLCFNTKYNPEYIELREDGKYPAGMYHYCWMIFENGYKGEPVFKWINNNPYILRKDKKKCHLKQVFLGRILRGIQFTDV